MRRYTRYFDGHPDDFGRSGVAFRRCRPRVQPVTGVRTCHGIASLPMDGGGVRRNSRSGSGLAGRGGFHPGAHGRGTSSGDLLMGSRVALSVFSVHAARGNRRAGCAPYWKRYARPAVGAARSEDSARPHGSRGEASAQTASGPHPAATRFLRCDAEQRARGRVADGGDRASGRSGPAAARTRTAGSPTPKRASNSRPA